jgi:hypothetical protein
MAGVCTSARCASPSSAALPARCRALLFNAAGLEKPNIGILDDDFLNEVRNLPERNLAVELLERLIEGEIKTRFATNVVQDNNMIGSRIVSAARY